VHVKIYRSFIESFDAVDNGIAAYPSTETPLYAKEFSLIDYVSLLNPMSSLVEPRDEQFTLSQFLKAVEMLTQVFDRYVLKQCKSWLPSREIVAEQIAANQSVILGLLQSLTEQSPSDHEKDLLSRVFVMTKWGPWKDHLHDLESPQGHYLYAIYLDEANNQWRVQAVPKAANSFESRLALPLEWRGQRDQELDTLLKSTGCKVKEGAVFVHKSGFIGGHQKQEGALSMALEAMKIAGF
jgi:uncharacterized UPF0160 family protein